MQFELALEPAQQILVITGAILNIMEMRAITGCREINNRVTESGPELKLTCSCILQAQLKLTQ